jgi:hypothetical protein
MRKFKVVYNNGDVEFVDGKRVYVSDGFYVVDERLEKEDGVESGVWYADKSKIKCILPKEE